MQDKVFADTNILIYAHDVDAGFKHDISVLTITELWEKRNGVLSVQVLQEFYVNVTRKIHKPISRSEARAVIKNYLLWHVQANRPETIVLALEMEEKHCLSFWDAMIVAAAYQAVAKIILTEDLNHGQKIEGILIKNPFKS